MLSNDERLNILVTHFHYDPVSGVITNATKTKCREKGARAGTLDKNGYLIIQSLRLDCTGAQAAWAIHHKEWPPSKVRTINGDPNDLRAVNLTCRKSETPSIEALRSILSYDPSTGLLTWLVGSGAANAGDVAGSLTSQGYVQLTVGLTPFRGHVMAWALFYGKWPDHDIDHWNNIKSDNRIKNLREATSSQNACNRKIRKPNKSGLSGVNLTSHGRYRVRVSVEGRRHEIGVFGTPEEADVAYRDAVTKMHGEFAFFNEALR